MTTRNRALLAALLALALLLGATGVALAHKGEGDDKDDDEKDDDDKRGRGGDDDDRDDDKDDDRRHGKSHAKKDGDKWIVRNDQVSVWFHTSKHGEKAKPHLKVFWTGADGNKTGYSVKVERLLEVEMNGTEYVGTVNKMNLERADEWNLDVQENGSDLTLRMTRAEAQGIVTLVWHLNATSREIKFDLLVDNWKWGETPENHRLVLDIAVEDKGFAERNATSATLEGGYVTWATTAEATYANGTTVNLTVGSAIRGDGNEKHILLSFNGPGGYKGLVYDPSFGVMSTETESVKLVPGAFIAGSVLALAAAAYVIRRTRQ